MADRFCGCITIGGQLARSDLPAFLRAIADAGVALEWGEPGFAPADGEELVSALRDDRLWLCDDQAGYGEFPELEETCRTLGLAYTRHSEGKYEYDPEVVDWRPGMAEPLVRQGSNSNAEATYVAVDSVKEALGSLEAGLTRQAMDILRALCPEVPDLPPFEIV